VSRTSIGVRATCVVALRATCVVALLGGVAAHAGDCGPTAMGGAVTVTATGSTYPAAPTGGVARLASGQAADLMLSGFGFDDAGGPLLFNHQGGIASDGTRLLLCDRNNNRVLVWSKLPRGNEPPDLVLGQRDFVSNAPGTGRDRLNWPVAVATDGTRVLVADAYNDRILIWTTFPRASGAPADLVLGGGPIGSRSSVGWPWGLWTDGSRIAVSSTASSRVLIWTSFPTADGQPADLVLTGGGKLGTPRTIVSDGRSLLVGDHNARVGGSPEGGHGNFVWKTFPTADDAPYDYFLTDPEDPRYGWLTGAFAPDGKLILLGRSLYLWDGVPANETSKPSLSVKPAGFTWNGGDGSAIAFGGGRLYVSAANSNKVLGYDALPTRGDQLPDFVIGSPDLCTSTLETSFIVSNPVPATDGRSLFVSSDFDRKLYVWGALPDRSGAAPDFVYTLPEPPWDNALSEGRLVLAGGHALVVWNRPPANGELPDAVLVNTVGGVTFQDLRGVALDGKLLYVADEAAGKVYVWDGIPAASTPPRLTLSVNRPSRLDSDGTWLAVTRTEDHLVTLYRVADLVAGTPKGADVATAPGFRLNRPEGVALGGGRLFVGDTPASHVYGWTRVEDAAAGRAPDLVLGSGHPEIGRGTLFWPATLAFDGAYLWVGEFKFSERLLRFGGAAAADTALFVPAAASAAGRGGSRWTTDLVLESAAGAEAWLSFLPPGDNRPAAEVKVAIPAGKPLVLSDVVGTTLGASGGGGIRIRSRGGLSVRSTTYDAAGESRVAVPALPASEAVTAGTLAPLASREGEVRTNAGFLNPGTTAARVALALSDGSRALGKTDVEVPPLGFVQLSDLAAILGDGGALSDGSLSVTSSAPVFAWATVVRASGATTFLLAEPR